MSPSIALLVGRILLALIFIIAGLQKFGGIEGLAGYIGSKGFPAPVILAWLTAIFEVVAGIFIVVGFKTKPTAFALAAFCIFTGIVFHFDFGDRTQAIMFMKNISMAGGFIILSAVGAGSLSADSRKKS